jgi:hypothetical protein
MTETFYHKASSLADDRDSVHQATSLADDRDSFNKGNISNR